MSTDFCACPQPCGCTCGSDHQGEQCLACRLDIHSQDHECEPPPAVRQSKYDLRAAADAERDVA